MNQQKEIEKAAQNGQRVTKHGVTLIVFQSRLFNGKLLFFSPHDKLGFLLVKSGRNIYRDVSAVFESIASGKLIQYNGPFKKDLLDLCNQMQIVSKTNKAQVFDRGK